MIQEGEDDGQIKFTQVLEGHGGGGGGARQCLLTYTQKFAKDFYDHTNTNLQPETAAEAQV